MRQARNHREDGNVGSRHLLSARFRLPSSPPSISPHLYPTAPPTATKYGINRLRHPRPPSVARWQPSPTSTILSILASLRPLISARCCRLVGWRLMGWRLGRLAAVGSVKSQSGKQRLARVCIKQPRSTGRMSHTATQKDARSDPHPDPHCNRITQLPPSRQVPPLIRPWSPPRLPHAPPVQSRAGYPPLAQSYACSGSLLTCTRALRTAPGGL